MRHPPPAFAATNGGVHLEGFVRTQGRVLPAPPADFLTALRPRSDRRLRGFLIHYSFPSHSLFNFDETRPVQKGEKLVLRRIEAANKERANVRSTRNQTVDSLLTFTAADGSVLLSVHILTGRFRDNWAATVDFTMEHAPRVTRGTWPRYYV